MAEQKTTYRTSKVKSFLFFLLLAIIFWVLTKFSKETTATITASINYVHAPEGTLVSSNNLNECSFDMFANGFQTLSNQLKQPEISIDVSQYHEQGDTIILVSGSELAKLISSQLDSDIRVENVSIDELSIGLDVTSTKRVPVKLISEISYKEGYKEMGVPKFTPDSVTISGPSKALAQTHFVATQTYRAKNVSENMEATIALLVIEQPEVTTSHSKVDLSIQVDEFTQKRLTLPVQIKGVPEGTSIKLLPERIDVSFEVSVGRFNAINENDFTLICDYRTKQENVNFLVPKLVDEPKDIYRVELSTKKVEYLIFK